MQNSRINIVKIQQFTNASKFLISNHARVRMFQRDISTEKIVQIIANADIIERYPDDQPCPSALLFAFLLETPYHVVFAQCEDHLRIVTVYIPDDKMWVDYKIRG